MSLDSGSATSRSKRATARLLAALFGAFALPAQGATAASERPRIVSINLCADQLLLRLADANQIVGLSPYARDEARSWAAGEARRFPILSGTAEEVLALKPDLVLAGRFTKRATREMLRRQGFRIVELEAVRSLEEAKRQIAEVGTITGHPEKAAAEIAAIDGAVARVRRAAGARDLAVLPLQRRGWVSGGETLMTSLLHAVGLRNAGSALSRGAGRQVTLEAIVALKPELLLVSSSGASPEDQGSAFLQHEALLELYPPERRIVVPEKLTVCGGPMLAEALDRLAAAIESRR
jgi:iron complex transport system substrate-binding protein